MLTTEVYMKRKNAFIEQEEGRIYDLPRAWLCGHGKYYSGLLRLYFETFLFLQQNLNVQFWKRSSSTCWHVKSPSCLKLKALLPIWAQHELRVTYEHEPMLPFLSGLVFGSDSPKNTRVLISPRGDIREGSYVNLSCDSQANPPTNKYNHY